jgi:hypothetical protein
MLYERFPPEALGKVLTDAFAAAQPPWTRTVGPLVQAETVFCGVPATSSGDAFVDYFRQLIRGRQVHATHSSNEIVIYRENPMFDLLDLPHLGPLGTEAYRQSLTQDRYTPHTRTDITEWKEFDAD